jgi:hypothetical protein
MEQRAYFAVLVLDIWGDIPRATTITAAPARAEWEKRGVLFISVLNVVSNLDTHIRQGAGHSGHVLMRAKMGFDIGLHDLCRHAYCGS